MTELLVTLLWMLIISLVMVGVAIGAAWWAMARRNRVHPKVPTTAPLSWLWSPSRPAIAHRRLRSLVTWLRSLDDPTTDLAVRDRLVDQAVRLDRELVVVARMPKRHRPAALATVTTQIDRLDHLTVRLRMLAHEARPTPVAAEPAGVQIARELEQIDQSIGAFEEAHRALASVEADATLDEVRRATSGSGHGSSSPASAPAAVHRGSQPEREQGDGRATA
ncbi:MAG: cbb3-type cytochrome oxidase assembly protein [Acidimicrobiia bacterium]|nr:cbb3-type cytochrome oxidase assembly protein [Acidimicrobiia bacterium]